MVPVVPLPRASPSYHSAGQLCPSSARRSRNHTRARPSGRNRRPACAHGRPGQDEPRAAKAAAGHRCWETKVAKGTMLEPRWAGVADARCRRAASSPGGWVVKAKMEWCLLCEKQRLCFNFRRFFPLGAAEFRWESKASRILTIVRMNTIHTLLLFNLQSREKASSRSGFTALVVRKTKL